MIDICRKIPYYDKINHIVGEDPLQIPIFSLDDSFNINYPLDLNNFYPGPPVGGSSSVSSTTLNDNTMNTRTKKRKKEGNIRIPTLIY